MSLHKEINFETEICIHLGANGWLYSDGDATAYDRAWALFPADILVWVQTTQPGAPTARPHTSPGHRHGNSATTTPQALKGRSNPFRHHFVDRTKLIAVGMQFPPSPSPVNGRHLCSHATPKGPPSSVGAAYLRNRAATFPRHRSAPVPGAAKYKPLLMLIYSYIIPAIRLPVHQSRIPRISRFKSPVFPLRPLRSLRLTLPALICAAATGQIDVRQTNP